MIRGPSRSGTRRRQEICDRPRSGPPRSGTAARPPTWVGGGQHLHAVDDLRGVCPSGRRCSSDWPSPAITSGPGRVDLGAGAVRWSRAIAGPPPARLLRSPARLAPGRRRRRRYVRRPRPYRGTRPPCSRDRTIAARLCRSGSRRNRTTWSLTSPSGPLTSSTPVYTSGARRLLSSTSRRLCFARAVGVRLSRNPRSSGLRIL